MRAGWTFEDLEGNAYTPASGAMDKPQPGTGKMVWTKADADKGGAVAPFYFPSRSQQVNVYAFSNAGAPRHHGQ